MRDGIGWALGGSEGRCVVEYVFSTRFFVLYIHLYTPRHRTKLLHTLSCLISSPVHPCVRYRQDVPVPPQTPTMDVLFKDAVRFISLLTSAFVYNPFLISLLFIVATSSQRFLFSNITHFLFSNVIRRPSATAQYNTQ